MLRFRDTHVRFPEGGTPLEEVGEYRRRGVVGMIPEVRVAEEAFGGQGRVAA